MNQSNIGIRGKSDDLLQIVSALALSGFVGYRAAFAVRPAGTNVFAFETHGLHRLSASAFGWIVLASLTSAILSAPAEDPIGFINRKEMHGYEFRSAVALSLFRRNEVARAIVLAIADVIEFVLIRGDDHTCNRKHE
jgi:hypothetical protein